MSRNYRLVPPTNFDPQKYLTTGSRSFGSYEAKIEAKNFVLEDARLDASGKKILMSVL